MKCDANMLDVQTPKNLNICCKEIHLAQNSLDIKIDYDKLKNFESITINGVKFVKDGFKKPRLKDIVYLYEGDFYISGVEDDSLNNKVFNTEWILKGDDILPEEYLNNEITLHLWRDVWDDECVFVEVKL